MKWRFSYLEGKMDLVSIGTKKIKRALALSFRDTCHFLAGSIPHTVAQARGTRVLVYHGVVPENPFMFNSRFLTARRFEEHLSLFGKHFNLLTFDAFINGRRDKDRLNLLLTFDDGYRNNFEYAIPLLKKYRAPAVFFPCRPGEGQWLFNDVLDVFPLLGPPEITIGGTKFRRTGTSSRYREASGSTMQQIFERSGKSTRQSITDQVFSIVPRNRFCRYADYIELMTDEQLRTISREELFAAGSHTLTHIDLSASDRSAAGEELRESKKKLEQITGKPCRAVAFPYGRFDRGTLDQCEGYSFLFGTEHQPDGIGENKVIPRFTINPYISAVNELHCVSIGTHE